MVIARSAKGLLKRATLVVAGLWLSLAGVLPVFGAEHLHAEHSADSSESHTGSSGRPITTDTQAKKEALTLGFIMLGSIIVGGTILLALVVMWGNRTRRLARSPLPAVANRDELWFLKPRKDQEIPDADPGHNPGSKIEPEPK
jgi:hypothetical protein